MHTATQYLWPRRDPIFLPVSILIILLSFTSLVVLELKVISPAFISQTGRKEGWIHLYKHFRRLWNQEAV